MGDAMDEQCLQNPLDVVKGVTHTGQAATKHTRNKLTHLAVIHTLPPVAITLGPDSVSTRLQDAQLFVMLRGEVGAKPWIV